MPRARIVPQSLSLAIALLLAAPAAAQYGGGSAPAPMPQPRVDSPSQPAAPAEPSPIGDVMSAAACRVGRDANAGAALLATAPFSAEERTQAGTFMRDAQRCLRRREPILTQIYIARGAVAEALYEAQFASAPAARNPALGASPLTRPAPATGAEVLNVLNPMYGLVDCATPRQPDLVRALLGTVPRSPEEGTAMTAFNPTFIACVPAGSRLSIDPRVMRAFFAEALYRWSVVQRDGTASPWAAAPAPAAPSGQ